MRRFPPLTPLVLVVHVPLSVHIRDLLGSLPDDLKCCCANIENSTVALCRVWFDLLRTQRGLRLGSTPPTAEFEAALATAFMVDREERHQ